ncbi:MAG TPA: ATP-binding cassette domain-containing protein [Solirubrobacteraceae bacterium]|jgi:ABC-type multidrug transport system ATPase subunit|nr:ATP-binding cassette domain-containing protein [Solirubrobacteraceae bacterium]
MTLLALERVNRRHRHTGSECLLLREVSLELDSGEVVAVWGPRRSGRSTLLRIAAGIERPDAGAVRFAGRDIRSNRTHTLGSEIGYCQRGLHCVEAGSVLDELTVSQLARGIPLMATRSRSLSVLERLGASEYAFHDLRRLDGLEATLMMIARALVLDPSLLVIDEPTEGMDPAGRDTVMALLRSLAEEGRAVLVSTGEATALSYADRALSLSDGELHGSVDPELAPVVPLRRQAGV